MNAVETLQSRLRADLKTAMRERAATEMRVLRALLAAIDNAQAVPVGDRHDTYVPHAFGDAGVEIARLDLSADALEALLQRERQERIGTAEQMTALGQSDRARGLQEESAIVGRYLAGS
jgi:uncharacterized protein YqeY